MKRWLRLAGLLLAVSILLVCPALSEDLDALVPETFQNLEMAEAAQEAPEVEAESESVPSDASAPEEESEAEGEAQTEAEPPVEVTDAEAVTPDPDDPLAACAHISQDTIVEYGERYYKAVDTAKHECSVEIVSVKVYCQNCGADLYSFNVRKTITFESPHEYENGKCLYCKQKLNTRCAHANKIRVTNGFTSYRFADTSRHLRREMRANGEAYVDDYYFCPDCCRYGATYAGRFDWDIWYANWEELEMSGDFDCTASALEAHTYKNGVCTGCGYEKDAVPLPQRVPPTKVALSPSGTVAMVMGEKKTLTPVFTPSGATTTCTWSSSKPAVATVSATGVVTALSEGKAKITVATANKKKATVTVQVTDPYKPTGVSLGGTTFTVNVGAQIKLTPSLTPASARTQYTWTSAKSAVATVMSDGTVQGMKEGKAKITVTTANKKKATVTVQVLDPYKPESVTLSGISGSVPVGETRQLTPKLTPSTARTTYTWKSSKPAVANVSQSGVVTAIKAGSAKITVTTANGKKATVTVTVPAPPKRINLYSYLDVRLSKAMSELGLWFVSEWYQEDDWDWMQCYFENDDLYLETEYDWEEEDYDQIVRRKPWFIRINRDSQGKYSILDITVGMTHQQVVNTLLAGKWYYDGLWDDDPEWMEDELEIWEEDFGEEIEYCMTLERGNRHGYEILYVFFDESERVEAISIFRDLD